MQVETRMDTGDRTIYMAEILEGAVNNNARPMTVKYLYEHASSNLVDTLENLYIRDGILDAQNIQAWRCDR